MSVLRKLLSLVQPNDEKEAGEFDYEPHELDDVPADLYDPDHDIGETEEEK
jgi:hypothetical protein